MSRIGRMLRSGLCGAGSAAGCSLALGVVLGSLAVVRDTRYGIGFEILQFAFTFVPVVLLQAGLGFLYGITRLSRTSTDRRRGLITGVLHWNVIAAPFVLFYIVLLAIELLDARSNAGEHSAMGDLPVCLGVWFGHTLCGAVVGFNVEHYLLRNQ